jgi:adenylate cyclase
MASRRATVARDAPVPAPSGERQVAVLFAAITGAADAAAMRPGQETIAVATVSCGGRIVKTMAETVMAVFPSADAAAAAAAQMHTAIETLGLALRIAFHAGPVIQRDSDVFGDTVNVAWRLMGQATHGQVLTSDDTSSTLGPLLRRATRKLYPIRVKGKTERLTLCELVWQQSADVTDVSTMVSAPRPKTLLRLRYRGRDLTRRRAQESIVIGRDKQCSLVIASPAASRQHCTIERLQNTFVLQDHSTNGTYITVAGEQEVVVEREDFALRQHGWISLGAPRDESRDVVEYFCESV